jgi:3-dehydroquinate synthase
VENIEVQLGDRSYPIYVGAGLLADRSLLLRSITHQQVLVVTNEVVAPLYLDRLRESLSESSSEALVLPDGEEHKTLGTFEKIVDALVAKRFHRDACIVALGGGVIGDIAGFAAASYQRGIDFVQVPTTLLAQVDSSVGGKTAVNHPRAKNRIGAFHQPTAVFADTDTLATLPQRELAAGLAEVVKYGLILDRSLFEWLETHIEDLLRLDAQALTYAIRRSCEIKARVVADDERERGSRALLNLGHTFGHALEAIGDYRRWLHGEAVAIGTVLAARTSAAIGWLTAADCERIETLFARAGLPTHADGVVVDELLDRMRLDKKAGREGIKLVLLRGIGQAVVTPSPEPRVLRAAAAACVRA